MKKRLLSSILLFAIFIPIMIIGGDVFRIATILVGILATNEIINIRDKKIPIFLRLLLYFSAFLIISNNYSSNIMDFTISIKSISMLVIFTLFPIIIYNDSKTYDIMDAIYYMGSILFIGITFNIILMIRNYDVMRLVYLFVITISTDTFSYFAGNLSGRTKLIPSISPKKTVEGLLIGVLLGTLIGATFYHILIDDSVYGAILLIITMMLSFVGSIGDLVMSSIKRHYDKKDFSNLLPGHGGVLDRMDSILFVVIAFVIVASII